jgi:uncharacterized membrane protein YebE (DUF533 family)
MKGRQVNMQATAEGGMVTKTAAGATFFGSGTAILGWLSASELAAIGGLFVGLAGLAINFYFNWKRDRREQKEHEARMKELA